MLKRYLPHGIWIANTAFIFSLSIVGRDLLHWSRCCLNSTQLGWVIFCGFLAMLAVVVFFLWQKNHRAISPRLILFLCLVFLGIPYLVPTVEERLHLLLFSSLGFFCARALRFEAALSIALLMGLADEVLQHFLVDRVGDWRDVLFNCGAALWGAFIYRRVLVNDPNTPAGAEV